MNFHGSSTRPFEHPHPPQWDLIKLRAAIDAAGVSLWSWNVDSDHFMMDEQGYALWGVPTAWSVTFEQLSAHIHPADRDRVRAAFAATRALVGQYEIDFRIQVHEEVRWISARGKGDDAGIIGRLLNGIFLDVTQRKQAEEAHELLAGEMSHRVKNLLHVASMLTRITSQSAVTKEEMAHDLANRLIALGRAHELVRPAPGQASNAALLGDLLSVVLAPYANTGVHAGRVRVSVPKIVVGEHAATALAMVLHELATNSIKYGALSALHGTLDLACKTHGSEVIIIWTEQGGPLVLPPAAREGFGSKLLHKSMSDGLSGSIAFNWPKEGAIVTLAMNKQRIAA